MRCEFIDRELPRSVGFIFDASRGVFHTNSHLIASRLREYAVDDLTKNEIDRKVIHYSPWAGSILLPKDLELHPFQYEAVMFALARNRSYLGLDPGLGKTPISVVMANALYDQSPTFFLFICPPFLTRNTAEEFSKWKTFPSLPKIYNSDDGVAYSQTNFLIIPDSILHRSEDRKEILSRIRERKNLGFRVQAFVDEAHRYKNGDSARTKALLGFMVREKGKLVRQKGILDHADRITYLSGTPMPNRPIELYSILSHSAPETIDFMNRFDYGLKYCGGYETDFGWDFNGGSKESVAALAAKVKNKFMLRLRKAVLDLPPKLEEILVLSDDAGPKLAKMEAQILEQVGGTDPEAFARNMTALSMKAGKEGMDLHISTYRRLLGIEKAKATAQVIASILEETEESILLFAIHKEVVQALTHHLGKYNPLVITGETPMKERHEIVQQFQSENGPRLFIANIQAAGVGLTLTKATRVEFCEYSWVPGENDQASDRAHRIGQKESVYVRYHVFKNSIDKAVLETNLRKRRITNQL